MKPTLHNIPKQLGLDIQQTSDGFSLSKSEGGRTIYTIRASKAVQFKAGGRAELKNVHIVVYGKSTIAMTKFTATIHLRPDAATSPPVAKCTSTCRATRRDRRSPTRLLPKS